MTTNKERAAAYRLVAAELPTDAYWDGPGLTRRADELDPPKPEYPDGTAAWVTNQYGRRYLCTWHAENREWCIGGPDGDSAPGKVTKVEPLRVLADDEIAVKRVNTEGRILRLRVKCNKRDDRVSLSVNDERVLSAYADALDAEAGEQS